MYKNKYLKYKNKYLELQKQLGGDIIKKTTEKCRNNCYCGEEYIYNDDINNEIVILDCGCCMHQRCLIEYIRNMGINSGGLNYKGGLDCPNVVKSTFNAHLGIIPCGNPSKLILPIDIENYLYPGRSDDSKLITFDHTTPKEVIITSLDDIELRKFKERMESKLDMLKDDIEDVFLEATTKPCPGCGLLGTHWNGHSCHHIQGCPQCGIHYCWRCGQTETDNIRERYNAGVCKCPEGTWSHFCQPITRADQIVLINGYPCNSRCGCPICPTCKYGVKRSSRDKSCDCAGNCDVCQGRVNQGPQSLEEVSSWMRSPLRTNRNVDAYGFLPNGLHVRTTTLYNEYGFNIDRIYGITTRLYDRYGFNIDRIHRDTGNIYDMSGHDIDGLNRYRFYRNGIHCETNRLYDNYGFKIDKTYGDSNNLFDEYGFNIDRIHRDTGTLFDLYDFNIDHLYQDTHSLRDPNGFNIDGLNKYLFNREGIHNITKNHLNLDGFRADKTYRDTGSLFNDYGFNIDRKYRDTEESFDERRFDYEGNYIHPDFDNRGFNSEGIHISTYPKVRVDEYGFDRDGYYMNTFKQIDNFGFNKDGIHIGTSERRGTGEFYDHNGYDIEGYNDKNFNRNGINYYTDGIYDKNGYNQVGLNDLEMTRSEMKNHVNPFREPVNISFKVPSNSNQTLRENRKKHKFKKVQKELQRLHEESVTPQRTPSRDIPYTKKNNKNTKK